MYLQFSKLQQYHSLVHFVSTRKGGVSASPFSEANLSYAVQDSAEAVAQNREAIARQVGFEVKQLCVPQQTHSANIRLIAETDAGQGAYNHHTGLADTDGMVTAESKVCMMVFSADCVLTLLYDHKKQVIGAVHGGWRGTTQQLAAKAALLMQQHFGSKAEDILVGIAPAIGLCCYEVGEEVAATFANSFAQATNYMKKNEQTGKYHLALQTATAGQLRNEGGILPQNIEILPQCTSCQSDLFFSSRKNNGLTGRFGAGIMLK
jgi:polyphenol oxidase